MSNIANVGGITMRWEESGDGPAVVLMHGIPTCPGLWRHVVPRILGARCLAWEMVGYGASIPGLKVPARNAWCTDDQSQKIEYGERTARDLGAPVRLIEGAKHFTPEDHPEIIAEEIGALLAGALAP